MWWSSRLCVTPASRVTAASNPSYSTSFADNREHPPGFSLQVSPKGAHPTSASSSETVPRERGSSPKASSWEARLLGSMLSLA